MSEWICHWLSPASITLLMMMSSITLRLTSMPMMTLLCALPRRSWPVASSMQERMVLSEGPQLRQAASRRAVLIAARGRRMLIGTPPPTRREYRSELAPPGHVPDGSRRYASPRRPEQGWPASPHSPGTPPPILQEYRSGSVRPYHAPDGSRQPVHLHRPLPCRRWRFLSWSC